MLTFITEQNPTVNAIAVEQGVSREFVMHAIKNRGVPVKDGRVNRLWLGDVILEIRAIRKRSAA